MASWTKPQAERAADDVADGLAEAFGIERPEVHDMRDVFASWHRWEWHFEAKGLRTVAGEAELAVDVSAEFAHLYFRFADPEAAFAHGFDGLRRLNPFSGKWNRRMGPELDPDLSAFVTGCLDDFRRAAGLVPVHAT